MSNVTFLSLKGIVRAVFDKDLVMYSASSSYDVDDVVWHNMHLWKCVSGVTAGSAWDASKWEKVTAASVNTELAQRVEFLEESLDSVEDVLDALIGGGSAISSSLDELNGVS